jgi:hypothetical protein
MLGMTEVILLGAMGVAALLFLMIGAGMIGQRKNKNSNTALNQQYWLDTDGELVALDKDEYLLDEKAKHLYDRSK